MVSTIASYQPLEASTFNGFVKIRFRRGSMMCMILLLDSTWFFVIPDGYSPSILAYPKNLHTAAQRERYALLRFWWCVSPTSEFNLSSGIDTNIESLNFILSDISLHFCDLKRNHVCVFTISKAGVQGPVFQLPLHTWTKTNTGFLLTMCYVSACHMYAYENKETGKTCNTAT